MSEKSTSEVSRDLRLLYQKGNDALSRENLDYALDLFNQVLAKEPGFFDCRKALRVAQEKKSAGASTGFFKRVLSSAGSSPLLAKAQLALRRDAAEALAACRRVGLHLIAADGHADDDLDTATDLAEPTAWVFGSEAHGLPVDIRAATDRALRVPIHGAAESLNLATAAAICLYTSARAQRSTNQSGTRGRATRPVS